MTAAAMTKGQEVRLTASLTVERVGDVAVLRLSRPEKRNALNDSTVDGLHDFFGDLPEDVKAVVLCGVGDNFCAGLDLGEVTETDVVAGIAHSRRWHAAFDRIQYGRAPVIAVLHGAVVGGGLELASACHIRIAEPSTYYALPEGQRGIFVGGGGAVRVPRLVGLARMTDMMLTGRVHDAQEGHAMGMSQYLVEAGTGLSKAMELAGRIAGNSGFTNFAVMHALPRIVEADPTSGLLTEALVAAVAQGSPEAKARLRAFLEKRAPKVVPT